MDVAFASFLPSFLNCRCHSRAVQYCVLLSYQNKLLGGGVGVGGR